MNIRDFKEGEIITRNEGMRYAHNGSIDGSYLGDRMVFQGVDEDSKIIFFINQFGDVQDLSFARDPWDSGWTYYPETLLQKAKDFAVRMIKTLD